MVAYMNIESPSYDELTRRRQELVDTINRTYTPEEGKFGTDDVNRLLDDDDPTRTPTLDRLASEDHYSRRVPTGGNPILVARKTHDDDETAGSPSKQEQLARKVVNEEGISLTPEDYHWATDESRQIFTSEFNAQSKRIHLTPTWTRKLYVLTVEGHRRIREHEGS